MASPITSSDIALVRGTWANVVKDAEANGVVILKTFLDKHDYYSKFERFKDYPRDKITENPIFRNHCVKLMMNLDAAIQNLDNPEELTTILTNLGKNHKKRKIVCENFQNLKVVILDVLKSAFKITSEESDAWNKTLTVAFKIICDQLGK